MSEQQWSEDAPSPAPKKGIPSWAWFVGGGCLLMLLLALIVGWFLFAAVKESIDPEKQWPRVAKVLPFDERPAELTLTFGNHIGVDMYYFMDSRGYMAILFQLPARDAEKTRKQFMDPEFSKGIFGMHGRRELKSGEVRVQGRDLHVLRFIQEGMQKGESNPDAGAAPAVGTGASALIDLTPEDAERPILLQLIRTKGGPDELITDQTINDFLKPFHVGTGH